METVALLGIGLWLILFWGLIGCCYFWFNCLLTWENSDEKHLPEQLALFENQLKRRYSRCSPAADVPMATAVATNPYQQRKVSRDSYSILLTPEQKTARKSSTVACNSVRFCDTSATKCQNFREEEMASLLHFDVDDTVGQAKNQKKINNHFAL